MAMPHKSLVQSIQKKIARSILMATMGTAFFLSTLGLWQRYHEILDNYTHLIEQLQVTLVFPIWTLDQEMIHRIILAALKEENTIAIVAYNEKGEVLDRAHTGEVESFHPGKELTGFGVLTFQRPIFRDGELLGKVQVWANCTPVYFYFLFEFLVVVGLCFVFLYFIRKKTLQFFHSNLVRPLKILAERAKAIRAGNYDTDFASLGRGNELDDLNLTFKEMVDGIKSRDASLKHHAANLESLIDQRTQELEIMRGKSLHASRLAALGEMSAGIAHEINNPLAVILGKTRVLKSKLTNVDASEKPLAETIEKIEQMALRIQKIVISMRAMSRDGSRDQFASVSLKKIIFDILEVCEGRAKSADVKLMLEDISPEWTIECQEFQIIQVISNLLNNAFDAIQALSEKWIRISIKQTTDGYQIEVVDSGTGISKNVQTKIMDPFFTTKEAGKGTGLGLSISRSIAKSHQGNLEYDPSSQNTKFILSLPRRQQLKQEAA